MESNPKDEMMISISKEKLRSLSLDGHPSSVSDQGSSRTALSRTSVTPSPELMSAGKKKQIFAFDETPSKMSLGPSNPSTPVSALSPEETAMAPKHEPEPEEDSSLPNMFESNIPELSDGDDEPSIAIPLLLPQGQSRPSYIITQSIKNPQSSPPSPQLTGTPILLPLSAFAPGSPPPLNVARLSALPTTSSTNGLPDRIHRTLTNPPLVATPTHAQRQSMQQWQHDTQTPQLNRNDTSSAPVALRASASSSIPDNTERNVNPVDSNLDKGRSEEDGPMIRQSTHPVLDVNLANADTAILRNVIHIDQITTNPAFPLNLNALSAQAIVTGPLISKECVDNRPALSVVMRELREGAKRRDSGKEDTWERKIPRSAPNSPTNMKSGIIRMFSRAHNRSPSHDMTTVNEEHKYEPTSFQIRESKSFPKGEFRIPVIASTSTQDGNIPPHSGEPAPRPSHTTDKGLYTSDSTHYAALASGLDIQPTSATGDHERPVTAAIPRAVTSDVTDDQQKHAHNSHDARQQSKPEESSRDELRTIETDLNTSCKADDDDIAITSFSSLIAADNARSAYNNPDATYTIGVIHTLLVLPFHLERFLWIGVALCIDSFLHALLLGWKCVIVGPMLAVPLLWQWIKDFIFGATLMSRNGVDDGGRGGNDENEAESASHVLQQFNMRTSDVFRGIVYCAVLFGLSYVPVTSVYHYIRVQSTMKLYVVYNMSQIFERLLTSVGDDITESLYSLADGLDIVQQRQKRQISQNRNEGSGTLKDAVYSRMQHLHRGMLLLIHTLVAIFYLISHTALTLLQLVTLNVAINSQESALFVILQSNNFIELKSFVFKKYFHATLFQVVANDVVERFQLLVTLAVIALYNLAHLGFASLTIKWLTHIFELAVFFMLCEVGVDAIKHAFMVKFNRLPLYYKAYSSLLWKDALIGLSVGRCNAPEYVPITRRLGFSNDPVVLITISSLTACVSATSASVIAKFVLMICIGVLLYCWKIFSTAFVAGVGAKHVKDHGLSDINQKIDLNNLDKMKPAEQKVPVANATSSKSIPVTLTVSLPSSLEEKRVTADLATFYSFNGGPPADKSSAANSADVKGVAKSDGDDKKGEVKKLPPLPIENVVRYGMYANKIPM